MTEAAVPDSLGDSRSDSLPGKRRAPDDAGALEVGLFLDGLHCTGCCHRVERMLRETAGVVEASVNYTTHRALVRFDPSVVSAEDLVANVEALGYEATPFDPAALERPSTASERSAMVRLLVAAFLAGNVMWLSVALYVAGPGEMDEAVRFTLRALALALTVPALTWCAAPFWRGAWNGLRRGELTVDVPIVAGITTAFGVGVAGTWLGAHHLFMDSAAMIVFLVLLGRTLERRARGRAHAAVDRLATLAPEKALRRTDDGVEEVLVESLRVGDRVVVPAGARVPTDGLLRCAAAEFDEAPFSGEALPVVREHGEPVIGGSCNLLVEAEIEVTARSTEGTLARLAELLERAQWERPRIQRAADRVASFFAPAVLVVAAATGAFWAWQGLAWLEVALITASVLIVACPCALGLATPAAITAAVGRAAGLGILVKSGEALERCATTRRIALDKTGTLTEGRFAIREIRRAPGVTRGALLAAAASAEGSATHPVAIAIREAAEREGSRVEAIADRTELPGRGVIARDGAETLRVGSARLLAEAGVTLPRRLEQDARELAARGLSLVAVARDDRALGVIALWDPPREDAKEAVARLEAMGIEAALVTGDHEAAAKLAGASAGVGALHASQRPEDKVERVRELRGAANSVAFVGDGINDAAAMSAADVGIAMHRGSDLTLHAADLVVLSKRLGAVPDAIGLARTCVARIRENLGFALLYNACAVPLAVAGWLEPLHAAIAMSASSVVVTGNAIRLLRWQPR